MFVLVGEWCAWLTAAGRSAQTVALRRHQLARFVADVGDPLAIDADAVAAWLASRGWAAATLRSHRDALRSFYEWAVASGRLDRSPAAGLGPVRVPARVARPTPAEAVASALACPDPRTRLMVSLAAHAGLRRGEISRIHSEDLRRDLVGWSLLVHGKGGQERLVPLVEDVAFGLRRSTPAGFVFPGAVGGHLSAARVGELVSGVLPAGWTCHTLRHYFATNAYAATRDVFVVQRLLGHAKPETTAGYVGIGFDALRAGVTWAA